MKRKIVPIGIAALVLGLLFNVLFFGKPFGISILLYSALILGATFYLSDLFKVRVPHAVFALTPVILFFAAMVFFRASGMLMFFNVVLITYLLLLVVRLYTRPDQSLADYTIGQYFSDLPVLPFRFLREANTEVSRALSDPNTRIDRGTLRPILRGVIITLPIVIVLILLLSSADLVFQKYVTSIFSFHLNGEFIARTILVLLVAGMFIGAFTLLFMRSPEQKTVTAASRLTLGGIEMSIVLGSVVVLFLLFLLVQATYFFGGARHVLTTSFTYADYARRGFFELIAVAAISLMLIWLVKKSVRLNSERHKRSFKWLSLALLAEVMVIMTSAHMRLSLYEQAYGYTRQRLLAQFFIYWLAVAGILAAIYIIRTETEQQFAFRLFISVIAFFAILNLVNPDALIARHNIKRLETTGKIDANSLSYLSEDATPTVARLLTSNNQTARRIVAADLYKQKLSLACRYPDWQSANFARLQAKQLLGKKEALLYRGENTNYTCVSGQLR